jgi:hypothetical protein
MTHFAAESRQRKKRPSIPPDIKMGLTFPSANPVSGDSDS